MIRFIPKPATPPLPDKDAANRFDQIRKGAADGHRKAEADKADRPAKKRASDDDKLL